MASAPNFQLPVPPPPLHTRASDMDRPETPSQEAFISPQQTPQGSPSKHQHPPGAFDLPHVFENAMRLLPTLGSPARSKACTPSSPTKAPLQAADEGDYSANDLTTLGPGSPTRKANKENTPPSARPGLQKEPSYVTHAAQSRQEPYRPRDADQSGRYYQTQRLSAEDLEKARKPAVKRLANVTQLCKCEPGRQGEDKLIGCQISSITTTTSSPTSILARAGSRSSKPRTLRLRLPLKRNTATLLRSTSGANEPISGSDVHG
jgi:cell cycle protein kinase DBF2